MASYKVIFTFLLFLLCVAAHAEVYKWVDDKGKAHFSDKKPEKTMAEELKLIINTYTHVTFDVSVFGKDPSPGEDKAVIMYSTEWCGYCKKARRFFQDNNIAFTEYDIEKDQEARRQYKEMGARGVPVILVGKKRMNGFSEEGFERIYK